MFKIEVTEITEHEAPRGQDWVKLFDIDERVPSRDKVENYGYRAPTDKKIEKRERRVLLQEVQALDIVAVIKAINGIDGAGHAGK